MIDQSRSQRFHNTEENLKKRCIAAGIEYKPPVVNEKKHISSSRRETMLLLLEDPAAIRRRDKKRGRDRKRKLTEEQRTNKNKKKRKKYSLSREQQKHCRLQDKWDALLNMISKYKNNQSSKEVATISGDTIIFDDHDNCNRDDEFGNEESTNDIISNNNNINCNKNTIMTSYIYIHQMKPGPHNITKAERTRSGQRGDMYRTLQQISIMPGTTFMYLTEGGSSLRACPHGAALESDKELSDKILNNHKVKLIDISKETAKGEVYEVDGVRVVYNDSKIIQDMENQEFKQQIIAHFIEHHQKTEAEQKNKNRDGHSTAKFTRLDGGVQDRYPRNSLGITKTYNGEHIPIIKTKNFEKLSPEVLKYLFEVIFPSGQKFLDDREGSERYTDKLRNNLFAYQFNNALGFGSAKTRFEYYDILVTEVCTLTGAILYRHVDGKNDNRSGYTGSVVYSFHCEHKGLHYKCSIIMTSRNVCGAAMDRIRLECKT